MDNNSKHVDCKSIVHPHNQAEPQDKEKAHKKGALSLSLHILVVDDEPLARDVVSEYLNVYGHTCEVVTNGKEGLEKFHKGRFDLVITDYEMPGIKGTQLANLIKRIAPEMPIIMLTGYGNMMKKSGKISADVDLLLNKPVTLIAFKEALTSVMVRSGSC